MYTKKEREYYNEQRERACLRLGITKNIYNWFRREGDKLHKIYENECNGLYDNDEAYYKETEPIENKIIKKADSLYLNVFFQTDPRGATIYLDDKDIKENSYTDAVCIY